MCALTLLLLGGGCKKKQRKTTSVENTTDYAGNLQALVATKKLVSLHWSNFSDYQRYVTQFYDDRNYELAWTRDGKPPADAVSVFDVAMTVNVMRYISDLRIGRVNPEHFHFGISVLSKKYDLAEFVSDNAVDAVDVPKLIASVEPDSEQYRETEAALGRYLELAKQQEQAHAEPLPMVKKAVSVGEAYPAVPELVARLQLEGDLAADVMASAVYDEQVAEGVKSYQHRHGIAVDGKLTAQTITSMNVPLTERVIQLQDSLERWRWLPNDYLNAPLMVNLPEFVLHGYDAEHKPAFTMKVVVGKVLGAHQTPVFAQMMRYLVFRPYWNVPYSIVKNELMPHIRKSGLGYLASKNFEVTNGKGDVLTSYSARDVAQGAVQVRERPGAKNSLGLVKLMFPNQFSIYLHGTPATQLFDRTRRDFSHGCIRVQKPDELAAWALQGQNGWDLEQVQEAMNSGPNNKTVNLKTPIPVVIFYVTGLVEDDGHVHFFDDIYGYDSDLQKVLAKGPPYPVKPDAVAGKAKDGDTA
jgi:murein L,D-transpeptidase YcbB/YkuD